ncbi:hypothetical protein MAPG_08251 [Magnaporthiopsis poae ATCC 64411]|uniref:Uncharacterized protein n=1 Tax=Magnaporthiopsis poae (strain ATCC 64411 / 73-15) TaxID=644358 RepID=A0A0C4E6V4_MAGP6|nr:hypothetical protein MAPG_08251 [Magnaporthiopsis poae ATCC 64411]
MCSSNQAAIKIPTCHLSFSRRWGASRVFLIRGDVPLSLWYPCTGRCVDALVFPHTLPLAFIPLPSFSAADPETSSGPPHGFGARRGAGWLGSLRIVPRLIRESSGALGAACACAGVARVWCALGSSKDDVVEVGVVFFFSGSSHASSPVCLAHTNGIVGYLFLRFPPPAPVSSGRIVPF